MTGPAWVRLDNASNIFLAARSDSDPKVFRISADLDHDIDEATLQVAVDQTYARYRLYHAVLRHGVFWYYLQDSDLQPVVTEENQHTCAPIYHPGRRNLLFRVVHHRRRISLELFHALSDGTGALWFLTDVVTAYVRLRHSHVTAPVEAEPSGGLTHDSFGLYFRRHRRSDPTSRQAFREAAASTGLPTLEGAAPPPGRPAKHRRPRGSRIHRVKGTYTPDNRTRVVELTMPARDVLALARAEGAQLTMYLTALFFESVRLSSGGLGKARTMTASVPVNLRQFFPSTSPRNFFATVRVEHTFGEGADEVGAIARQLEGQFRPKVTPEALEKKLRRLIRFERMPVLRILPRPVKDLILGLVNRGVNRSLTVAVSNLGRVVLPEPAEAHVGRMLFHVSAARPQFCAISHAGLLTVSFTSPFTQTGHVREFARLLTARGVHVSVAAARVTEAELVEVEP